MSAIRKIVVSAAIAFLGLSGVLAATGVATAAESRTVECDNDWHIPCP